MKKRNQGDKINRLRSLVRRCCEEDFSISFLTKPDQPPPSWEEAIFIAMEAYRSAMQDVLTALEGDFSKLEGLFIEGARSAIIDTSLEEPLAWLQKKDVKAVQDQTDSK
jgi:hypothetical protein